MDTAWILAKTSKGVEEMKHRSYGLPLAVRPLLIMIDGSTSVGNLLRKTAQIPNVEEILSRLINEGFVESVMPAKRPDGLPAATAAGAAGSHASDKQALIAMTRQLLGEDADKVIQRLQDTPDARPDLLAAVERCHKLIKLTIDEAKARSFLKAGQALLAEAR
jgi:hypothetical protein